MFKSRLDRVALSLIAGLIVLIVLMVARGDQVGSRVVRVIPDEGATDVSVRSRLAVTFDEPMRPDEVESRLSIEPPISGTLRWNGATAFLDHAGSLAPDTTYTVTLRAGATSQRRREMLGEKRWTFRTGHPRVLYLAPATGVADLFAADLQTGRTQRLTSEPFGVFDFAVSPDGKRIAYSATRDEGGVRDLYLINSDGSGRERIVTCDEQACQYVAWSADGTRLAFERRNLIAGTIGKAPGPSRIWLYEPASKKSAPLLADSQQLGSLPRWAPMGDTLAYYDPLDNVITAIDTRTGQRNQVSSMLGDPGSWAPDGRQIAFTDLQADEEGQFSQIMRADLVRNMITPLLGLTSTNDSGVAWSPVGDLIAFTRPLRDLPVQGTFAPFGPQVHVVAPDGTGARVLTDDVENSYGGLSWSPGGDAIAAVRINLSIPDPKPEVWLIKTDGSRSYKIADNATLPGWLP